MVLSSPVTFWCNEDLDVIEAVETRSNAEDATASGAPLVTTYTVMLITGRGYTNALAYTVPKWVDVVPALVPAEESDTIEEDTADNAWGEGVAFPAGVSDFFIE